MSPETAGEAGISIEAVELTAKKPRWRIELSPDALRGQREGGPSFEIPRSELSRRARFVDSLLAPRILALRKPTKHLLQFERSAYQTLEKWTGKPLLLRMELRNRFSWVMPIGILFVIAWVPLPGNSNAGLEPVKFDALNAALGGLLIVQGLLARVRPDRVYLLLDSAWFLVLAIDTAIAMASGASLRWTILIALQAWLIVGSLRSWRKFGGMEEPAEEALLS